MGEINRKFTIGKLEIRKFIASDYLYLSTYITLLIFYLCIIKYKPEHKFPTTLLISWIIGFLTISTPFGLRFRNIYFSTIWLILSILFLIDNYFISTIPLSTFILYHILRIIFWKKNHRELIPFQVGRGGFISRHRSYFEGGQSGSNKDKVYTKILLWTGILIIMLTLFQLVGVKIK